MDLKEIAHISHGMNRLDIGPGDRILKSDSNLDNESSMNNKDEP